MGEHVVHLPVLVDEIISWLSPCLDGKVIDATVGSGGHAEALLTISPAMSLLGIDCDPEAVDAASRRLSRFGERVKIRKGNFRDLGKIAREEGVERAGAVLFDLGTSSHQLGSPERGFSVHSDGPLDMRMDPDQPFTAGDLLLRARESELAETIAMYGEERRARRIASRIVEARRRRMLRGTQDLARAAARMARGYRRGRWERIHPATRTFQAIRIAVNRELESLEAVLPQAEGLLMGSGRMAVISFHSLEDRVVKHFMGRGSLNRLTKKPVRASWDEISRNPRARSAKLRVGERL